MAKLITVRAQRQVATVTLNRPALHNALDEQMMIELTHAFDHLAKEDSVRVAILAAQGKSFCAGADISWMKRMVDYSFDQNVADANILARMLRSIRECRKPVIARVHGAAIGGGVGLTAACDLAVAVPAAVFCLSEVKLGIIPAVISPFVIEKIGPGHARRYALTAERFDAPEAHRIGLLSHVAASEVEMDAWITSTCATVRSNGPHALAGCKQVLAHVWGVPWDQVQAETARRIAQIRVSPEGQEGLKAFLEKRKPGWAE